MSWSTIAASEVLEEFTPQEQASLQTIQDSSASLTAILARTVNQVRGYIRGGGNQLDAELTVPDQLRNETIDIARWRWLRSFPTLKALQTKDRKDAHDAAMETLKDVAKPNGGMRIELPATATAESNPAPVNAIQQVSGDCRQLSRRKTRGL